MEEQPADIDDNLVPPQPPPDAPPDVMGESMASTEPEPSQGFMAGVGGVVIFFLVLGLVLGPLLWWMWAKSPLRLWVKIALSLAPIVLLIIFL